MSGHAATYEPGQLVRNPGAPGWGLGQVQSVAGARVTVNFENAGKILINTERVLLSIEREAARPA